MTDYRALLRDRRSKAVRQKTTHDFCLNPELLGELESLQSARESAAYPFTKKINDARYQSQGRLSAVDTTAIEAERDQALAPIDGQIEAKKAEIRESSIILHFRAVPPDTYLDLINEYDPDGEGAGQAARRTRWTDALVAASFVQATGADGEPTDLTWKEIDAQITSFGEKDVLRSKVFAANKMGVDVPFSLSNSGKTREAAQK